MSLFTANSKLPTDDLSRRSESGDDCCFREEAVAVAVSSFVESPPANVGNGMKLGSTELWSVLAQEERVALWRSLPRCLSLCLAGVVLSTCTTLSHLGRTVAMDTDAATDMVSIASVLPDCLAAKTRNVASSSSSDASRDVFALKQREMKRNVENKEGIQGLRSTGDTIGSYFRRHDRKLFQETR